MVLLCSACGGEDGPTNMKNGAGGAGATTSGGMGTSGTTTGGLPASGAGGSGGSSSGGSSSGGSSSGGSSSGGSNLGGSGGLSTVTGPGTVTDAWSGYCLATFTSDYEVIDSFDDPLFTARAGEQYLMTAYPAPFGGPDSAALFYLTEDGPFEFEVDAGSGSPPFTANCPKDTSERSYAVFTDVSLYSDTALATKLCDLTAGTALPLEGGYGYTLSSSSDGEAIYSIVLSPYSAQCGAAERGSVVVPSVQVLDQNSYLVPIRVILGPI
jgi:hypothetical protein